MKAKKTINVGLLGLGNVGSSLFAILNREAKDLLRQTGIDLRISKALVRNKRKYLGRFPKEILTENPDDILLADDTDIVVELIGGIDPARDYIKKALSLKKPVVSANKDLIARFGPELIERASQNNVDFFYEASVAGAIPLVRVLRESLKGEKIVRIMGIVNGTTNYILSEMSESGLSFDEALKKAKKLGFAEQDPSNDVLGFDSLYKAIIMASMAYGSFLPAESVLVEGIEKIDFQDISYAKKIGYSIKLLAIVQDKGRKNKGGKVLIRVHPALLGLSHPLANVSGANNAIFIEGKNSGPLMLYGRGAGGQPTASAVLGDILDASFNLINQTASPTTLFRQVELVDISYESFEYYLALEVLDRPGVLAQVASVFGNNNVSIASMEQSGKGAKARLVFVTHKAVEKNMARTISELRDLSSVKKVGALLRIIDRE